MDFSKVLMRCSALSCLFTEPKLKADKEAGKLSAAARKYLVKAYMMAYWGIEPKDVETKQMAKGKNCETDAIKLLALVDNDSEYEKNAERKSNEYLTGECDIELPDCIDDIKNSWDAETFLPKLIEPLDDDYFYQAQGYMWLYEKPKARIRYCLVNVPESQREEAKFYLLKKYPDAVTEENPEFKAAWKKLESSMIFDHIPPEERVITIEVARDESVIEQIPGKVKKAREFLAELHQIHMKQKEKQINIREAGYIAFEEIK
jgi:hypothetical protein